MIRAIAAAQRMQPARRHRRGATRAPQRGVALVVILMLLLVVTLLGLAGIRGALLQERMAANAFARAQAFQAAEAVLREAETAVKAKWEADRNWTPDASVNTSAATNLNEVTSTYAVSLVGPGSSAAGSGGTGSVENPDLKEREASAAAAKTDSKVYRVTVTSKNADNGVEVQLESLYELSRE